MVLMNGDCRAAWSLPLVKLPGGAVFEAALQGASWLFFGSHWLKRVLLCSGDGCPGCVVGVPRVMGYRVCLVRGAERWRPALLEVSSGAVSGLAGFLEMEGVADVPGLVVELRRRGKRSPLRVEPISTGGAVSSHLGEVRALVNAIAVLYGLPLMSPEEEVKQWSERVRPMAAAHLVTAVRQGG